MPPTKPLSPTEWRIMHVCWRRGRATIAEILHDLADEPPILSFRTVHTLIQRLMAKGYLGVEEAGRRPLHFIPSTRRAEVVEAAAETFLDTVLAGEAGNLGILEQLLEKRRARSS